MIVGMWLSALLGPPLFAALWATVDDDSRRVRRFAVAAALASCAVAALIFFVPELSTVRLAWPWRSALLGPSIVRVSALSSYLVLLPPVLWLATIATTPSARLDRVGLGRTALGAAIGPLAFLTDSPLLLAICWAASSGLFLWGISTAPNRRATLVVAYYHGSSLVLLTGGIAAMPVGGSTGQLGLVLVVAAVLVRKGIFPFHAWIPEAFDQGRIGPTVLLSAPQLGTYVAATLVVPNAPLAMLRVVAVLSLVTAVYGAALALYQADARRTLGYLFVSQSALVLAGLDCTSEDALTGALVLWISSALAFTGVSRTVLALEARRGRLWLTRHHGGFDQMPLLAASFLMFGLACSGFPGTLGFIGQEMLVDDAVRSFPAMGFLAVAAAAFTGLAVLRMYFSLFCGSPSSGPKLRMLRREALVFGGIAVLLVASGVFPGMVVRAGERASEELLRTRDLVQRLADPAQSAAPSRGEVSMKSP